jgi:hypothetical protein
MHGGTRACPDRQSFRQARAARPQLIRFHSGHFKPCCHPAGLAPRHHTFDHPFARIVGDKGDMLGLAFGNEDVLTEVVDPQRDLILANRCRRKPMAGLCTRPWLKRER